MPSRVPAILCWFTLFLGEAEELPQDLKQIQLVSCDLFFSTVGGNGSSVSSERYLLWNMKRQLSQNLRAIFDPVRALAPKRAARPIRAGPASGKGPKLLEYVS